jgi:hypothetical protein
MMNLSPERDDGRSANLALARRIRLIREELFGPDGVPILADALQLSSSTLLNYETGSAIPPRVLLRFLEVTATNPHWLLTGTGPRYLSSQAAVPVEGDVSEHSPTEAEPVPRWISPG